LQRSGRLEPLYGDHLDLLSQQFFDLAKQGLFFARNQRDRLTFIACTTCAADPVNIVLRDHRKIEIDHHRQLLNVEASRGNVGRDENPSSSNLEVLQGTVSRALALVAVNRVHAKSPG